MMHAWFFLLSLFLRFTSAAQFESSLFSRRMNICDAYSPTLGNIALRSCATKVGNGYCLDANGESYPYCAADTALTSGECLQAAKQKLDAIGWEYDSLTRDCLILFDTTKWNECPFRFTESLNDVGRGPIQSSMDADYTKGVECFAC